MANNDLRSSYTTMDGRCVTEDGIGSGRFITTLHITRREARMPMSLQSIGDTSLSMLGVTSNVPLMVSVGAHTNIDVVDHRTRCSKASNIE